MEETQEAAEVRILPLKRGGADDPSNMHWQSSAEAKAKDRVE